MIAYVTIFALYALQAMPMQFFYVGLPSILKSSGIPLSQIGWLYVAALPWAIKFLWAPLVDRYNLLSTRRYRNWITLTQILMALLLIFLATIEPSTHFMLIIFTIFFFSALCATQDIAVDGLSVTFLHRQKSIKLGSSLQGVGGAFGGLLGGALVLLLFGKLGWASICLAMGGVILFVAITTRFPKVLYPMEDAPRRQRAALAPFWAFFKENDKALWVILLLIGLRFPSSLGSSVLPSALVEAGYSLEDIALLNGTQTMLASGLGALSAGILAKLIGLKRTIFAASASITIILAAQAQAFVSQQTFYFGFFLIGQWFFGSVLLVAFYMIFNQIARPTYGGSDFTLLICIDTIISLLAGALAHVMAEQIGFGAHFLSCSILLGLCLATLAGKFRGKALL